MTRRLLFGIVALSFLISCNNLNSEQSTTITSAEFATVAENLIDQTVSIEGTVLHICKHGGKKMFINEDRVKVIASEKLAAFDLALEGSAVIVTGIIREESVPVLSSEKEAPDTIVVANTEEKEDEVAAEDCDMEKVKPLYVIEVIKISEVSENSEEIQ
ncbi:MAG: hypothetical protein U9N86_04275 [Bacteroidota bacterium]|nr:hypothetical protein [Bacteroidota bacterium]